VSLIALYIAQAGARPNAPTRRNPPAVVADVRRDGLLWKSILRMLPLPHPVPLSMIADSLVAESAGDSSSIQVENGLPLRTPLLVNDAPERRGRRMRGDTSHWYPPLFASAFIVFLQRSIKLKALLLAGDDLGTVLLISAAKLLSLPSISLKSEALAIEGKRAHPMSATPAIRTASLVPIVDVLMFTSLLLPACCWSGGLCHHVNWWIGFAT
jgi:hypothetical protein